MYSKDGIPITYYYVDERMALKEARALAGCHVSGKTTVPLYLRRRTKPDAAGFIVKADEAYKLALQGSIWQVTQRTKTSEPGHEQICDKVFSAAMSGERISEGFRFNADAPVPADDLTKLWGFATPLIALKDSDAKDINAEDHITAYRVIVDKKGNPVENATDIHSPPLPPAEPRSRDRTSLGRPSPFSQKWRW